MNEMNSFAYAVVRVVPDPVRDEAINLGVIVVDVSTGAARGEFQRFTKSLRARIRALMPATDTSVIEDCVDGLRGQLSSEGQLAFVPSEDARIVSSEQLSTFASEMSNQLQMTPPRRYRGETLGSVVDELYALLISPRRRPPAATTSMTLRQLKTHIRKVIERWESESIQVDRGLERTGAASHYADFWVASGRPLAALIAIPNDPGEKFEAWARRDSIPTIAGEFGRSIPNFKAVAVFPPNGLVPSQFVRETLDLMEPFKNVLVLHADQLDDYRAEIAQELR